MTEPSLDRLAQEFADREEIPVDTLAIDRQEVNETIRRMKKKHSGEWRGF